MIGVFHLIEKDKITELLYLITTVDNNKISKKKRQKINISYKKNLVSLYITTTKMIKNGKTSTKADEEVERRY